ncbi:hypothetical protein SAMN05216276_1008183 [Streptosporangium subroseum]|uniref:Uncharacterized protein n=1 Tax=Streptosporangium subroseum TaxID=106412 RepID=A0A239E3X2_9ACTN|nr:hypothetical protein [Streptosporangium subroseum]SNS38683.1 hypothetical protein SAMN05216276_1008183 [Streptosporangium subroseum]
MGNRQIDPLKLRSFIEAGTPYREIADYFHVSVGGVQQAVERLGMQKKNLRHDKFIPWQMAKEHSQSGPVTSLRILSKVAQGQQVPLVKLNSALRWAVRLHDEDLDIDYTKETGFFEKPADKAGWHIAMVLEDVNSAMTRDATFP